MKFILSFFLILNSLILPIKADESIKIKKYEIYPNVKKIEYKDEALSLQKLKYIYLSEDLDKYTEKHIIEVLDSKGLNLSVVDKESADVVIDVVENVEDDFFNNIDAYTLNINKNGIEILAKDTDAAFHGITTLKHIFDQSENEVSELEIWDYADTVLRGFIEGFYGIPWSNEERMTLMKFGSQFKMNTYLFAPKDDPYHNEKWREFYPQEELNELKELVRVGNETKNRFVWLIHPFMNESIRNDNEANFEEDIQILIEKFEQLYDIGVRQFGVNADDVFGDQVDAKLHVKVMERVHEWNESKEDNYNLIFTPSVYNEGFKVNWANGPQYLKDISYMPEDIHIMWTGNAVLGHVTQRTINQFKENLRKEDGTIGRNPYFWFNWPVNDINSKKLFMGPGDMLLPVTENLDGIATNPMQQAEASKVGIFAVADYSWNLGAYDKNKSWTDSFKYIEESTPESLQEISRFMRDTAPQGWTLEETEDLNPLFQDFKKRLEEEREITEIADKIIHKMDKLEKATVDFLENGSNEDLKEEIRPWVRSLNDTAQAMKGFLDVHKKIENGESDESVWKTYVFAKKHYNESKEHTVQNLDGIDKVLVATKYVTPFLDELHEISTQKVSNYVLDGKKSFSEEKPKIVSSEKSQATLTIGDAVYTLEDVKDLAPGNFVGFDLGRVRQIENIEDMKVLANDYEDLKLYFGENVLEMIEHDEGDTARYVVFRNEGEEPIKLDTIVLKTVEYASKRLHETNFKEVENPLGLFNDDLRSRTYFRDTQTKGKFVTYDLGQNVSFEKIEIILNADEHDYIRNASIQISKDNEDFVEIGRIGTGEDNPSLEEIYPDKDGDYVSLTINAKGEEGRYIKILIDQDISVVKWARINALVINEGEYLSPFNNPSFTFNPREEEGYHPNHMIDNDLSTSFLPVERQSGELRYAISNENQLKQLLVLSDSNAKQNAQLSARVLVDGEESWVSLGTVDEAYKLFDLENYDYILEFKLTWENPSQIYQLVPVFDEKSNTDFNFVTESDKPGTDKPGTDKPGTDKPGTDKPGTDKPGTDKPGTDKPGTDKPGTDKPGTDKPGTDKPGTDKPGTGSGNIEVDISPEEDNHISDKLPSTGVNSLLRVAGLSMTILGYTVFYYKKED